MNTLWYQQKWGDINTHFFNDWCTAVSMVPSIWLETNPENKLHTTGTCRILLTLNLNTRYNFLTDIQTDFEKKIKKLTDFGDIAIVKNVIKNSVLCIKEQKKLLELQTNMYGTCQRIHTKKFIVLTCMISATNMMADRIKTFKSPWSSTAQFNCDLF